MSVCRDIFNKGYMLYTDNWYTSLDISHKLLNNYTHLTGTLLSNWQGNLHEVMPKKLKHGEIVGKDFKIEKQGYLLLLTKHTSEMLNVDHITI